MIITLKRIKYGANGTFGRMLNEDGGLLCYTLERPWDDNAPDKSCIPAGTYNCINYSSTKFPDVWQIINVPGRSDILIHNGNTENDTHGCIVVGDSMGIMDNLPAVFNSVKTLKLIKEILPDIFTIVIQPPDGDGE